MRIPHRFLPSASRVVRGLRGWPTARICAGILIGAVVAAGAPGQQPSATSQDSSPAPVATATSQPAAGGLLHGLIKSGNIPLPGVAITATNTLTGKRFATTTDITGAWSMAIPQNGRYVIRTEFAAFAASTPRGVTERCFA